jgi:phosphate transport system substrate-binding protein
MTRIARCLLAATTLLHASCGGTQTTAVDPLTVDGSSTVFPLTDAVAQEFTDEHDIPVNVAFSGTVTGFERFCNGLVDVANASRPINSVELQQCESKGVTFFELPVAYDGVTVIVHPRNDWVESLVLPELRVMWGPEAEGKIVRWKQLRPAWPDQELHLVGPGAESGTFDFFTDVVSGKAGESRKDYQASGDDQQIVDAVASDELAIGYVGFGYYERNKSRLKAVPIDDLDHSIGPGPVEASAANISRGIYRPLSRPLFIYVNTQRLGKPGLDLFTKFYLQHAGRLAADAGTVPMAGNSYQLAQQRLAKGVKGTMYATPEAESMSVDLLLNR